LLVRTLLEGLLVMVAMCRNTGCQSSGSGNQLEHADEYLSKEELRIETGRMRETM
jgi:NADH:ubiquinone oxidoreductase subunit E